jgi:hypothetical protein
MYLRLITMFLIIISSGSIIFQIYGEYLTVFLFFLIFLLFFSAKECYIYKKKHMMTFFISISLIILYLIFSKLYFSNTELIPYIKLVLRFLFMGLIILYYLKIGFYKLQNDIYIVLKFILLLSIINFIIINLFSNIFVLSNNFNVNTIIYIFNYMSQTNLSYFNIYRNQGLFWEPGVLQVFINLLIFLSLYVYKERKIYFLSILTIISTFSTIGILIAFIMVLNYYFINSKLDLKRLLFFIPIGIIIGFILYINIMEKLYGSGVHSSGLRYLDFIYGLNIISNYPLMGIGYDQNLYISMVNDSIIDFTNMSESLIKNRGNTNGILSSAIYLGIPFSLFMIYSLYRQIVIGNKNIVFILFLLTLLSEPLIFTNFFLLIIFSGLVSSIVKVNYAK